MEERVVVQVTFEKEIWVTISDKRNAKTEIEKTAWDVTDALAVKTWDVPDWEMTRMEVITEDGFFEDYMF